MLCSPLGAWHARLCERVYTRLMPALVQGSVSAWWFEFVVGGLLLESLVTWRGSGQVSDCSPPPSPPAD